MTPVTVDDLAPEDLEALVEGFERMLDPTSASGDLVLA